MSPVQRPPVRWGILGVAAINTAFLPGLAAAADGSAHAIASRSLDRARSAARQWGIPVPYGSYEDLLDDDSIDAVYIPLPNHLHAIWVVRALRAGKHVLCEKPLAIDPAGMSAIRAAAAASGTLVVEAFMYRFAPRWRRAMQMVREGVIGDPRLARIGFAFQQHPENYNIRFDPGAGGGIEWDMGCYVTAFARDAFGAEPVAVTATGYQRPGSAVTTSVAAVLAFAGGRMAVTHASFDYPNPYSQFEIIGDEGWIALPGTGMRAEPFTRLVLHRGGQQEVFADGRDPESTDFPFADPYRLEIDHFNDCVINDHSPEFGLDDAQANMQAVLAMIASRESGGAARPEAR